MSRPATGSKDITENTTQVNPRQNLTKRSRSKFFAMAFILRMVDVDSHLRKSYWNSYHCCDKMAETSSGKTSSNYCNNRWCLVCNRIRSAKMIHAYMPVLKEWDDKHFVTLTIPNVPADGLNLAIDTMQAGFRKIKHQFQTQNQRKQRDEKLIGLRKLECTYSIDRDDYHPHYHAVIQGEQNACDLLAEWLKRFPDAKEAAQDIRPADDDSVHELFKYFTKLIAKINGKTAILPEQLDVMFRVLRGKRTFQNFGFIKPKGTKEISDEAMEIAKEIEREIVVEVYQWCQEMHDWIGKTTGKKLTGYEPSIRDYKIVEEIGVRHE